jgi:hypothetical protein
MDCLSVFIDFFEYQLGGSRRRARLMRRPQPAADYSGCIAIVVMGIS